MAKTDLEKLIRYSKEHESEECGSGMRYDTGSSSMVYSRGNVLLGQGRFLDSLHVNAIKRVLVNLFF
jgi:hypothetical protein